MSIFGDIFDFNGDGELDSMEKAAEFGAFMQMMEEEESDCSDDFDDESYDEYDF